MTIIGWYPSNDIFSAMNELAQRTIAMTRLMVGSQLGGMFKEDPLFD
jgi:hypothetical protein